MSAHVAPFEAPRSHASGDPKLEVQSVAQLVAAAVCGLHRVNDQFVQVNATLGEDGYIDVEVTHVDFTVADAVVRVLLYPTAPEPVPSRSGPRMRSLT